MIKIISNDVFWMKTLNFQEGCKVKFRAKIYKKLFAKNAVFFPFFCVETQCYQSSHTAIIQSRDLILDVTLV